MKYQQCVSSWYEGREWTEQTWRINLRVVGSCRLVWSKLASSS